MLGELKEKLKAFQKRTKDPWIVKWQYERFFTDCIVSSQKEFNLRFKRKSLNLAVRNFEFFISCSLLMVDESHVVYRGMKTFLWERVFYGQSHL